MKLGLVLSVELRWVKALCNAGHLLLRAHSRASCGVNSLRASKREEQRRCAAKHSAAEHSPCGVDQHKAGKRTRRAMYVVIKGALRVPRAVCWRGARPIPRPKSAQGEPCALRLRVPWVFRALCVSVVCSRAGVSWLVEPWG